MSGNMLLHEVPEIRPGPVEAIHAKFHDDYRDENNISKIVDHHYETYLIALSQLPGPDNATSPGFRETCEWLLGDWISQKSNTLIQESGWSLYRLLTATDDDLKKIGIAFQIDRTNILNAIRAFHLAPWRTMQTISLKHEGKNKKHKENIMFSLETFSRLTQQIYIDSATISWLRQRIPKKLPDRERLIGSVKEAIETSKILIKLTEGIHNRTVKSNRSLSLHPVDYIGPTRKKCQPVYKRIMLSSIFLVSVSFLCPVIEAKISKTVLSPLCRLPIKWCIFVAWMFM